jgi:hypothetical protein
MHLRVSIVLLACALFPLALKTGLLLASTSASADPPEAAYIRINSANPGDLLGIDACGFDRNALAKANHDKASFQSLDDFWNQVKIKHNGSIPQSCARLRARIKI